MLRKYSSVLYYLICLVEGVGVVFAFVTGAEEEISSLRWLLFGLIALLMVIFGAQALRGWVSRGKASNLGDWMLAHEQAIVLLFISFVTACIVIAIVVYSPIKVEKLYAYALRWQPMLLWAFLICSKFFLLGFILQTPARWLAASRQLRNEPYLMQIHAWLNSPAMGITMIAVGFVLGLSKLGFNQFVDEADNLLLGWLITLGRLPYRDVFSQHFPFPYYWSAGIIAIAGNSQTAVRLSLLALQAGLFAYCMLATRLFFPVGLTALVWGLTSHFHRGNMVLYDVFDGIFILSAFILIFPHLVDRTSIPRNNMVLVGILMGCAFLSNPLMLYPVLVILTVLFLWGLRLNATTGWWEKIQPVIWVGLSMGVILGGFGLFALFSGSLSDLYRDVIWFNSVIYSQYTEASPNRLGQILYQIATGLDIFNPQWRQQISPFLEFGVYRFRLANEELYYSWIFSSFLFRLSILLTALGLFLRRKFLAGLFIYIFAATLLIRLTTRWHAIPFIWLSLFLGAYYLARLYSPSERGLIPSSVSNPRQLFASRVGVILWRLGYVCLLGLYTWSAISGGKFLIDHRQDLKDRRYVNRLLRFGEEIRRITCNRNDLEMLEYPSNPMVYFVNEIPPASKYTFLFPWVAQIAFPELISELSDHPAVVIEIKMEKRIWQENQSNVHLATLTDLLNQNYIQINDTIWMSREIARNCGASPPKLPDSGETP